MDINEFAKDVHQNAVEHGWWEDDRDISVVAALIHSEWSEALEEYRAGRPMVWHECEEGRPGERYVCESNDEYDCTMHGKEDQCKWRGKKPEGIAVELIDGCIRIFDYLGKEGIRLRGVDTLTQLMDTAPEDTYKIKLPRLIANLHLKTSQAYQFLKEAGSDEKMIARGTAIMFEAVAVSCCWIREQGHVPEAIMRMKHSYNRTRPYKHGGKTC